MSRLDQGMPHTPSDYLDNSTKREAIATLGDDTAKIPDFHSGSLAEVANHDSDVR